MIISGCNILYIFQARASDDSSTVRMKRASLVKAGEALSPDAFMLVLDGESNTKDPSTSKGPPTALGRLAGRAKQFEKGVSKAAGHLKRLGDENDQERLVKEFLGSLKAGRDSSVVILISDKLFLSIYLWKRGLLQFCVSYKCCEKPKIKVKTFDLQQLNWLKELLI